MRDVKVPDYEVPAYDYVDLGLAYAFPNGALDGLTIRAGVDNLADRQPPVFPTYPTQYDVLGRRYYVRFEYAIR